MDTRLTTTQGLWRLLVAAILALALCVTPGATPASAAKGATCTVTNTDTGRTFPRLQQAVDAAKPGARLVVKGTCVGGTFIDKDIAIRGVKTQRSGRPTLDGDNKARVLVIKPSAEVNLRNLVVREGRQRPSAMGGGIANKGSTTLREVVVRNSDFGVANWGTLRVKVGSLIRRNARGIYNEGTVVLGGPSRISKNGQGVYNIGTLTLNGSSRIIANGGTGVLNEGTVILNGSSHISRNDGGVINYKGAVVTLNDTSAIRDNHSPAHTCSGSGLYCAPRVGGGVNNQGALTLNGASAIYGNSSGVGGGVFNLGGTVTMTGSSALHHNEAKASRHSSGLGGGLYDASAGTLVGVNCAPHTYASVYGNTPDDCYFE